MSDLLRVETNDLGVASVIMNRPDVHNAFNADMIAALRACFDRLAVDADVRIIVLRGAGPSFSAGGDLNYMKSTAAWSASENKADAARLSDMLASLNHLPKPTIAMVHGSAFGGGVGLVACADIAIAVQGAKFGLTEIRLGMIPAAISPFVLAAIGSRAARRYFLTGERFDAATALQLGLVHHVVQDQAALEAAALDTVNALLAGGPNAMAHAKALIAEIGGRPIDQALRHDAAHRIASLRGGAEGQEGMTAFFEKRPAKWVRKCEKF
ncbi:MAG: enoyl-CoA hydratase/isomerase family protein [Sphingomonadales bacterium]